MYGRNINWDNTNPNNSKVFSSNRPATREALGM